MNAGQQQKYEQKENEKSHRLVPPPTSRAKASHFNEQMVEHVCCHKEAANYDGEDKHTAGQSRAWQNEIHLV